MPDLKRLAWVPAQKRRQQSGRPRWRSHGDHGLWSCKEDPWIVARRAGARRRWNARRRKLAEARREKVEALWWQMLETSPLPVWGARARIARTLGVHRSTITRDMHILIARDGPM